jgi:hypothetical protein
MEFPRKIVVKIYAGYASIPAPKKWRAYFVVFDVKNKGFCAKTCLSPLISYTPDICKSLVRCPMAVIIQTVDGVVVNRFDIDSSGLSIGRAADNQVQIDDSAVSTNHAEIIIEENKEGRKVYVIRDSGSTNGTFLNEQKVEYRPLRHKDVIRVGWNNFVFIDEGERDYERTDKITRSWIPGIYFKESK